MSVNQYISLSLVAQWQYKKKENTLITDTGTISAKTFHSARCVPGTTDGTWAFESGFVV